MRTYVFGDTGGHQPQLWRALINLGVDLEIGYIPEDIRIIHLGDLIHKGEYSNHMLPAIDKLIRNNPNRWIQILGNHEFQHIEGAPYFWNCDCNLVTQSIINNWWEEGLATATYALDVPNKIELDISDKIIQPKTQILFSHAGLTYDWWEAIRKPENALLTSNILNQIEAYFITAPGEMLGVHGGKPGPVWAVGNTEVFKSWVNSEQVMPFTQIHGHTSSYKWDRGEWWNKTKHFKPFREVTKLNPETRAVITSLQDNLLIGIDPGYSIKATTEVQPFITIDN